MSLTNTLIVQPFNSNWGFGWICSLSLIVALSSKLDIRLQTTIVVVACLILTTLIEYPFPISSRLVTQLWENVASELLSGFYRTCQFVRPTQRLITVSQLLSDHLHFVIIAAHKEHIRPKKFSTMIPSPETFKLNLISG